MSRRLLIIASLILIFGFNTTGLVLAESEKNISISQPLSLAPISIYDEENLLKISIEDIGKFHGDICPCVAVGFRAMQLAVSELWKDEIPKRGDFKIISAHPGRGLQDAFEFVTRAKSKGDFVLRLSPDTDRENLSLNNYEFNFIRKSTNEQIKIQAKEGAFPSGSREYFKLRKKAKFQKTATEEDKKAFKKAKQRLKDVFMDLPIDKLFEFEKSENLKWQ